MRQGKVLVVYYLNWLYYLKVDCDKLNVYTMNSKKATKITVYKKANKRDKWNYEKNLIPKNTKKENKVQRRQK